MIWNVTIEESISQTFKIEAEEKEDAVEIAIQKYKAGELVVENGELVVAQVMAEAEDGTISTSWTEVY